MGEAYSLGLIVVCYIQIERQLTTPTVSWVLFLLFTGCYHVPGHFCFNSGFAPRPGRS